MFGQIIKSWEKSTSSESKASKKRIVVGLIIIAILGYIFWVTSRYPDLIHEQDKAENGTLTQRNLGIISKDEIMSTRPKDTTVLLLAEDNPVTKIGKSTVNWLYTNRKGMLFGVLFGAAILNLVISFGKVKKLFTQKGFRGSLVGMIFGIPLGVCANCVAPVGLSMNKKGMSLETTLSAMVASPTLNVIAVIIAFIVFPLPLAILKVAATLFLILVEIPLLVKMFFKKDEPDADKKKEPATTYINESWLKAVAYSIKGFFVQVLFLSVLTVPLMLLAGFVGALIAVYLPLESLIELSNNQVLIIVIASIIGTLLPIPMLVDLIFVAALLNGGLPYATAAALLVTLPSYSIFGMVIVGRYISWKLASFVYLLIVALGIIVGLIALVIFGNKTTLSQNIQSCPASSAVNTPFKDITTEAGLSLNNESFKIFDLLTKETYGDFIKYGGVVAEDFNNDNYVDLYFVTQDGGHLFKNLGNLKFEEVTLPSGIEKVKNGTGAVSFDYDNDGLSDLLVYKNGANPTLYKNLGDFKFKDVTNVAGLENVVRAASGVAVGDYDKDGWLDMYITSYFSLDGKREDKNILLKNDHGVFKDVTKEANIEYPNQSSFAATFIDYDKDGWPDIFVANDFSKIQLFKNNKNGTFTDLSKSLPIAPNSMGISTGDYNNDGFTDLYLSGIYNNVAKNNKHGNALLKNKSGTGWMNSAKNAGVDMGGWSWGTAAIDYDNSGFTSLAATSGFDRVMNIPSSLSKDMVAPRMYLYKNNGSDVFKSIPVCDSGLELKAAGRGLVAVDLNNDGYLDLVASEWPGNPRVFHNKGGENNWIKIKLAGTKSNKQGIGAKVTVVTDTGEQTQELDTTGSFLSSTDSRLSFGLGTDKSVKEIRVLWPSGGTSSIFNTPANQQISVQEK